MDEQDLRNRRAAARLKLQPMYTHIVATRSQEAGCAGMHGHVYDISNSGLRMELDEPLPTGEIIDLQIDLPGLQQAISATGDIVWVHSSEDDPGPTRMALKFKQFGSAADQLRLRRFLEHGSGLLAA